MRKENTIKINIAFVIPKFKKVRNKMSYLLYNIEKTRVFLLVFAERKLKIIRSETNKIGFSAFDSINRIIRKLKKRIEIKIGVSVSTIIALLIQISMLTSFLSFPIPVLADDFCSADVDVVLIMDVSGSMEVGESPSQCEWENLERVGQSWQCVSYSAQGLTEGECNAKPNRPQCDSPQFSPATQSKIDSAKQAANSFINNLSSNDQSAVVSFSDLASLEKELSNDHSLSSLAIDNLITGGGTNIGDAINEGISELGSQRANPQATKAMILLTDGKANRPNGPGYGENPDDVAYALFEAEEAASFGYKVFTIGLGSNSDINGTMLTNIADITGARYHRASNGNELAEIYDEISQEVCQYGSISGCKYNDANNNGEIDQDEEKMGNWEIVLAGDSQTTQLTDETGCYTFAGLLAGNYTVSETLNSEYAQTYPLDGFYSIVLADGENISDKDFANYLPVCANNILDQNEQCDDGNTENRDGCSSVCEIEEQEPICGDNVLDEEEQCDDGNIQNGDGCSSTCQIESLIQPGDIVINEIMQNPQAVSDTKGEWFELFNTTDNDIDIEGCAISDSSGENHIISASLTVSANNYAVLARNIDSNENGGIIPDYVYSTITLSNSSDEITFQCNAIEIDRVDYDGGPNFPDPTGASMILDNPLLDNNIGANWCESSSVFGQGDFGTPGALNDACHLEEPSCGNSVIEEGEQCDDTNTIDGDGCSSTCQIEIQEPVCGNNILDEGEQCDDGNIQNGDGCSSTCQIEIEEPLIQPGDIVINEIMQNPFVVLDNNGEWFELFNITAHDIDIEGCVFGDSDSDSHTIAGSLTIPSNDYIVLTRTDSDQNGGIVPDYIFSGMSLSNSSDEITFQCNAIEIDRVDYDGGPNFPDPTGASMILDSPLLDNNIGANWCESSSTFGQGDFGTPGAQNNDCHLEQPACGNSVIEQGEQCDDTNTLNGDGCSSTCQIEIEEPVCGNNILDEGEQCDDGNVSNGDGCSSLCQIEQEQEQEQEEEVPPPSKSSSKGGGPAGSYFWQLSVSSQFSEEAQSDSVTLHWQTNFSSTSRVVYDTVPHPDIGASPDYGYAFSTPEDSNKVTYHTVVITGLMPNTTYYWRAISHGSPEIYSQEMSFTTKEGQIVVISAPIIEEEQPSEPGAEQMVLGEEAVPVSDQTSKTEEFIAEGLFEEPKTTEKKEGMFKVFLAAVGDSFSLENLLWILLIIIAVIIILLLLPRKKKQI